MSIHEHDWLVVAFQGENAVKLKARCSQCEMESLPPPRRFSRAEIEAALIKFVRDAVIEAKPELSMGGLEVEIIAHLEIEND